VPVVEKVIYLLWRDRATPVEAWTAQLRDHVAPHLLDLGARGLQVNVADGAVKRALVRIVELDPQMEAIVGVWLESARDTARRPFDAALAAAAARAEAYLVTESEPLRNTAHPVRSGERTPGFASLAFLRRPHEMSLAAWTDAWQNEHTQVAIDTQSTFGYVQNLVVRPLTPGAPAIDAVVEELFPAEAMTDLHAFFAAADDIELARNVARLTESTARFGADRSLDVVPTSQYVIQPPFAVR
jgi:hypothetical protein